MSYYESRLKINFEELDDIKKKLEVYEKLGVKNIILEYQNDNRKSNSELKTNLSKGSKINLYYRLNLKPNNVEDFKKKIKDFNNFPDIISVESLNKEIQIQAARDSRVDIVSFSDQGILKTLTPGVISLVKQNSSFIEFSLNTIMEKNKALQSKNFRNLYRFVHLALKLKVNFIISGNFDNLFDFRHPRALISVCHTLLEIPLAAARNPFSINPKQLVERALSRNNRNHIEEGVKLIRNAD